nr:MAG TPA: CHD-like protein [Caudoviricetes sp.]
MKYSKQTVIEGLERSIEKTKEEIEKYSKDCNGRFAQGRTAHREFLKKKLKKMEKQLKELENE